MSYLISEICSHTAAQPLQAAFLRPILGLIGTKKGPLGPVPSTTRSILRSQARPRRSAASPASSGAICRAQLVGEVDIGALNS